MSKQGKRQHSLGRHKKYELTINGGVPLTDKQKMDPIGLKMRAHKVYLKERGLPYVPSDVPAKIPNEILEENMRKSKRYFGM